jgi:hypothetical protein
VEIFKFYPLQRTEMEEFLKDKSEGKLKEEITNLSLGRPGIAQELVIDKTKILYYNSLLEEIKKIRNLSEFERLKKAEVLEKSGKTKDFLFLSEFWFRDLLLRKQNALSFSFSFKANEIIKESQNFSEAKLREIISQIEGTKNYLNFSNTNPLLTLENLLLKI